MLLRQFTRFSTNTPATLSIDGMMGQHKCYLNDVSKGGISLNALAAIKQGTHLLVSFSEHCKTRAKVAWCKPLEHCQCQLGLAFDKKINESALDKIVSTCV
jgi:hypothetical protein